MILHKSTYEIQFQYERCVCAEILYTQSMYKKRQWETEYIFSQTFNIFLTMTVSIAI